MNSISQILAEKKNPGTKSSGYIIPFLGECDMQVITEYTVFKRISQLDQFYTDKRKCNSFRFSGHINTAANLKFSFTGRPLFRPDFSHFEFDDAHRNWKNYLMAPIMAGDTSITVSDASVTKTIDFTNGLPALVIPSAIVNNKTRDGLLLYLGHNLQNGDVVHLETNETGYTGYRDYCLDKDQGNYIYMPPGSAIYEKQDDGFVLLAVDGTIINGDVQKAETGNWSHRSGPVYLSKSKAQYKNGIYRVADVQGNKIYIQLIRLDNPAYIERLPSLPNTPDMAVLSGVEIGITQVQFDALLTRDNVNWLAIFNSNISVAKVVDSEYCNYYMKKLTFIESVDNLYNCSFENNIYTQPTYLFTQEDKVDLTKQTDNLGIPLTSLYYSFVKKVREDMSMTTVQASFSNFVTSTFDGGGIQTVSKHYENGTGIDVDFSSSSNFLYHSLVEYNPLLLQETTINSVYHTFLCNVNDITGNRIRFSINPFHQVEVRKQSDNISESDVNFGLPDYKIYSEKFQTYRWRHIIEMGFYEAGGNGIDFPFLNDAFYIHSNILLNIQNYNSPKIPSILSGGFLLSSFVDTLEQNGTNNTTGYPALDDSLLDKNKFDKPFENFTGGIC